MIRIKVKHLLLIVAIIAFIFISGSHITPRIMYLAGVTYETIGNEEKANAIFRKLELEYPENEFSVKALYNRCANQFTTINDQLDFSRIYTSISSFGTSSPGLIIKPADINKINAEFLTISKTAHRNDDFRRLEMVVGLMNWFGGNPDRAIELVNNASFSDSKATRDEATLYLSIMNLQLGNLTKSTEILNRISDEDNDLTYNKSKILSSISLLKGEIVKNTSLNNYPSNTRKTLVNLDQHMPGIYGVNLFDSKSGNSGLKGSIKDFDSKLSGVIVGLFKVEIYEDGGMGWIQSPEYVTLASADGSFEFKNVHPGKYFVTVEAPWFQIKDSQVFFEGIENNANRYIELGSKEVKNLSITFNKKFEVEVLDNKDGTFKLYWTEVSGAAYYHIAVGPIIKGSAHYNDFFNATFSTNTKDIKYTLDTNKYRDVNSQFYGFSTFDDSNVGGIDENPILGAFYQSGEYGVSITAYDKRGQTISSTKPNSTDQDLKRINISGVPLSDADRLLIDHKYKEAIEEYKRLIDANPKDAHSIRMLAVLHAIGYLNDGTGKDINKALEYYKMLDRIAPSAYSSLEIGKIYFEKRDMAQAITHFKKIEDEYFEKNSHLAEAYFFNGDFYEAYETFVNDREYFPFSYLDPKILCVYFARGEFGEVKTLIESNYYFEEPEAVQKLLKLQPDEGYHQLFDIMKKGNRRDAEAWLEKSESSDSWRIFYESILNLSISDKEAAKKAFNKNLKRFGNTEKDAIMISALKVLARNCRGF